MDKIQMDLTGQKFGKWTALSRAERREYWLCQCECGKHTEVNYLSLLRGHSSACKVCSNIRYDLTGRRFDKLVILKEFTDVLKTHGNKTIARVRQWEAICDCGEIGVYQQDWLLGTAGRSHPKMCKTCKVKHPDITGQVIGGWRVVEYAGTKDYSHSHTLSMWRCVCSICNKTERLIPRGELNKKKYKGCNTCSSTRSRTPEKTFCVNSTYSHYKAGKTAKAKGFTLTKEDVEELIFSNCFHCGEEPSLEVKTVFIDGAVRSTFRNGIDRLDSDVGYTKENCVPCCTACNCMKLDYTLEEFELKTRKIYLYKKKKGRYKKKKG